MANALYPKYKQALLTAGINLTTLNIKVALIDSGTTGYNAAHEFMSSMATAAVARSGNLANKTVVSGVFDADNITITGVTGATVEALLLFRDSGVDATSELIAYLDTGITGIVLTPNGGDVTITWNGSGIFAL